MKRSISKVLLIGFGIAAITFLHYADFGNNAAYHAFFRRLYYLPIILAAFHFLLKGGVAASTAVSLAYLPHVFTYWESNSTGRIENLLEIAIFFTVGIVTGLGVSREKSLAERAVRSERLAAFGQMAEMLTKDLLASLAALRGLAQSFVGKMNGQAGLHFTGQLFLEHIDTIAKRFTEIEELAADRRLRLARCQWGEILGRCLSHFQNDFATHKVSYSISGLNAHPPLLMDAEKMERVVKFLITTLLQSLPRGGTLSIHAVDERDRLALHIAATGVVDLPRTGSRSDSAPVFELDGGNGAWYWLYVQRVVADHGGEIIWQRLTRRSTIFTLRLPLRQKLLVRASGGSRLVASFGSSAFRHADSEGSTTKDGLLRKTFSLIEDYSSPIPQNIIQSRVIYDEGR